MSDKLENENKKENAPTIKLRKGAVELKTIKKTQNQIVEAVEDFDSEFELLKTKCSYYESALERVLHFIVPDNCRGMVEEALRIGKSDFTKN